MLLEMQLQLNEDYFGKIKLQVKILKVLWEIFYLNYVLVKNFIKLIYLYPIRLKSLLCRIRLN